MNHAERLAAAKALRARLAAAEAKADRAEKRADEALVEAKKPRAK